MTYAPSDAPKDQQGKNASFTTFSFSGTVTVVIKKLNGASSHCTIKPSYLNLQCKQMSAGYVSIELNSDSLARAKKCPANARECHSAKISVEFGGDLNNQLFIFADAPEDPSAPNATSPEYYFGRGIHKDVNLTIPSGTTVVVAGGAYVYGRFTSAKNSTDITIRGRGVVSGEALPRPSEATDGLSLVNLCGSNLKVEGITFANAVAYVINVNAFWSTGCGSDGAGATTTVTNVKAIAWYWLTDAVMAGKGATITDSFFKVNDDTLKLFQSDTVVQRCVIWQLDNGMPFMISWITPTDESNIAVSDIHVRVPTTTSTCMISHSRRR
jgi:hypothetical protein